MTVTVISKVGKRIPIIGTNGGVVLLLKTEEGLDVGEKCIPTDHDTITVYPAAAISRKHFTPTMFIAIPATIHRGIQYYRLLQPNKISRPKA